MVYLKGVRKTCQSSIKQSTWQQKGRKRYKMEGPNSWQTKKPPKRANRKGMGTNQVPKPLHLPVVTFPVF
jgi:hypothetical protein